LIYRLNNSKPIYKTPGILPLLIFLIYILFQIVPLPASIVKILSPNTYIIYAESVSLLDPTAWLSISINKKSTLSEFFRYLAYVCIYFLTVQTLANKKKLEQTVYVVVSFATLLSVLAIVQYYSSKDIIYWFREVPNNSIVFGPYVNHNHFAGLIEMILPIAIALFLCLKPQVTYKVSFREKLISFIDPQRLESHILLGFSAVILLLTVVISVSRGALISVCLSMIFFILILVLRRQQKKSGLIFIFFFIAIIISVNWFGWDEMVERFGELKNERGEIHEARLEFWKDSTKIIKDFPITGIGFGNFGDIYPRYRSFLSKNRLVLHAHNDYLELMIEGGLISVCLVAWFFYALLIPGIRTILTRKERYSFYLFIGCLSGILAILFHSFTDFNTHIGANGLYLFFLFGLLISAANTRLRGLKTKTILEKSNHFKFWIVTPLASLALITGLVFNIGIMVGSINFASVADIFLDEETPINVLKKTASSVKKASKFDPFEGQYYYALGNVVSLMNKPKHALDNYKKAIYFNPYNGEILQQAGLLFDNLGDKKSAEKLLKAGIRTDISNADAYGTYATWLLYQDKKQQSMNVLKKALSLYPETTGEYIALMLMNQFETQDILEVLPDKVRSYIELGNYLEQSQQYQSAELVYKKAFSLIEIDEDLHHSSFSRIAQFYINTKREDEALNILLQGINYFPNDVNLRIKTAKIYFKLGIPYRSKEEYKKALTIDPKNKIAVKALNSLF